MKFDIARKVVKFQNGQFGIRRWTPFGYQFLDLDGTRSVMWWGLIPEYVAEYAAGTEKKARARLDAYLNTPRKPKPSSPGYDKGRPA